MKYWCWALCFTMCLVVRHVISYTCRISQFVCHNSKCISNDRYCDGVNDCGDSSDEPIFCTVCNRTYYGDVGNTYHMILQKPTERKLPFLCHLTFTAYGHEFGDIVQLSFEEFYVGRLERAAPDDSCPGGFMQILELGRPFTGGSWCGKSNGLATYYSESSTVTLTIRLFYTGRYVATPFQFALRYTFIRKNEANVRYGTSASPIDRGEITPGTYCSRNYYECHRKKCQLQSPNYPGIYPRNVTCLYQIRQKTVPKCKHGMILVRQTNRHKMKLKRSTEDGVGGGGGGGGGSSNNINGGNSGKNASEGGLKVWRNCDDSVDRIVFYDGLSVYDSVLLTFCGGDWLPPVLSRGPQMLVAFHSCSQNTPLQAKDQNSPLRGFELDADTVFTDSDSFDFSRHRSNCEFLINATESETENGIAVRTKNRSGSISSPRHTLPPNTTCTYHFQGRTEDHVWLSIASYWQEPLVSAEPGDSCPTRLRIWDGGGRMLGDHCSRPKICDHLAVGNRSSRTIRPCTAEESYISHTNSVITQYFSKPGTAVHPTKFLIHYEFVNTALGGRVWLSLDKEERSTFDTCSRLFKGIRGGVISSPKNVFMFARGGAKRLACLYRVEAEAGQKISLTLHNVSFGANVNCRNVLDPYTDQYVCVHNDENATKHSELQILEIPWRDVKMARSCFCDNVSLGKLPSAVYTLEAAARVLELRFRVFYLNVSQDFYDINFYAKFSMIWKPDCPRRQRIRGFGGEIQMVHPPYSRPDVYCQRLPWLVEARVNHSLFILTWGRHLPVIYSAGSDDDQAKCANKNRILIYAGSPFKLLHVICPSHQPRDSGQEIHIFSEDWQSGSNPMKPETQRPPSFLIHFIGKESGTALLNWLEISRSHTSSLHHQTEHSFDNISLVTFSFLGNHSKVLPFECPFHCPEISACISGNLWCDGYRNCPSGYDELDSHCNLKYKMIRNYVILTSILLIILVLTIFVLVATIKRFRLNSRNIDEDILSRRIATEETLYDQSISTLSS